MSDFKPLYRYSFSEAKDLDEQEQWRESLRKISDVGILSTI